MSRPRRKRAGLIVLGYAALLTAVSLLPSDAGAVSGWDTAISPGLQNILHVPAYGLLAWLVARATGCHRLGHLAVVGTGCAAFGGLLECVQAAVPGRFGSLEDTLLNAFGAGAGVLVAAVAQRRQTDEGPGPGQGRHSGRERSREIVRRHYHERGWRGPYKEYEAMVAQAVGPNASVLDVGCGRSFPMAPFLAGIAGEVHGVDPTADTRVLDCGAVLNRGTGENLPFDDATFDTVISRCVLEHVQHPVAVFNEFRRVLRPGGKIVFLTPSRWDYVSLAAAVIPNWLHGSLIKALEGRDEADTFPTYYRANSARAIRRIAAQTGFRPRILRYYNHYPYLLTFSPLLCRLGILYDKAITRVRGLHPLQAGILATLVKDGSAGEEAPASPRPLEGRTILCFASGYDAPPTSKHHVMHLLAERNTVLWVNYHASRTPSASGSDLAYAARKLAQVAGGLKRERPNLYTLTPLVAPLPSSATARRLNRAMLVAQIRRALAKVRRGPLQVWSFTPDIAYLLDAFPAEKVLYYCVDDFASFTGYDRDQVLRDEANLCRRADLVVTTSHALQEAKAPLNPNTILVPHGVDYDHFARAVTNNLPVPEDMRGIPHPILGFFGLIRDWVDLDLLAEVAKQRPQWHIVLLGDADATVNLAAYRDIPNMHFLGRKPYADLPAYCTCFDVGLIPFKINDLTKAVNPIKLREYLAAGLPVVSTPLHEVASHPGAAELARTPDETVHAVEAALNDACGRQERSRTMARESWPGKLDLLANALRRASRPADEKDRPCSLETWAAGRSASAQRN